MSTHPPTTPAALPRRRPLARFGWLLVLLIGIVAYAAVLWVMVSTRNTNFFPSLLLIGSVTVPAAVLTLIWGQVRGGGVDVSAALVAATAVAGGFIGTIAAGVLEYDVMRALSTQSMLLVGIIEELAKLIVPLLVLAITRGRDVRAGVVIGVASGMGFATLETMGYGFNALLGQGGGLAAVDSTLLLRGLLAPAGHVAWTGLICAAMWRVPSARHRRGRATWLVIGAYLLAVALHATWDGSSSSVVRAVVALISTALLLLVAHKAARLRPAPHIIATGEAPHEHP